MNKMSEHYKWQFLRRNCEYQILYDLYLKLTEEDDGTLENEVFLENFFQEYNMQELLDYKNEKCPPGTFNKYRVTFHQIGPYSINQVRDREIFSPSIDIKGLMVAEGNILEMKIMNKFFYLEDHREKNLLTITLDISTPISKKDLKQFYEKLPMNVIKVSTKGELKNYGNEKDLEALIYTYEKRNSNHSYGRIYKYLKLNNLKTFPDETPEQINASMKQFFERSQHFVTHAKRLQITTT